MKSNSLELLYVGTLPPHPGGSAIVGYQLLEGLAGGGHGVSAIAPTNSDPEDLFQASYPDIALRRIVVPHFETPPHFPYSPELVELERRGIEEKMEELILRKRPDLIVIGRETYVRYIPDIARSYSIPCLLIIHGGLTHGIIDGSYDSQLVGWLLAQYKKADVVVTPAEHMAKNLRYFGVDVKVIPNGVNLELFSPVSDDSHDVVVMYVGHLRALKRPLDFVLGAELALQKNINLFFDVVGEGPLRERMEQMCLEKGISSRFRFIGWVPHSKMPSYLSRATMIVTPTQIENQSLIHLEAQACGRVLIASDIPAAREVIADGDTGLLFPLGDVEQLAAKILQCAADAELRKLIGRKARYSVEKHSMKRTVGSYIETMQGIVQRQSRASL